MTEIGIYLVTPVLSEADGFLPCLEEALSLCAPASVLLRLAQASEAASGAAIGAIAPLVQQSGAALVIDGAPELALKFGADGVHIRGVGPALDAAIKRLSPGHIVGAGGLPTRHDAMTAGEAGADYVVFGDWDAPLDLEECAARVAWWAELFTTPCVAHVSALLEIEALAKAGADFVMLGDCVWRDARGVAAALAEARSGLEGRKE